MRMKQLVLLLAAGACSTLVYGQAVGWSCATEHAQWSPRWGHSSAVFNNKLWVMGGSDYWDGNMFSDIWSSSDGVHWTQVVEQAPWGPRRRFPTLVYGNRLWILGGSQNLDDGHNDVWSSEDGVNWSQVTAAAPWSGRFLHAAVVFQNKMWVLGGSWPPLNDVWYSEDGVDWTQASTPPWIARFGLTALVFDGKLWILGGSNHYDGAFDDVWYTEDGENWTCATSNAGWEGRAGHASVVFDNKMWVFGGGYPWGPARNDVSWSSDGVNWTTAFASWEIRVEPAAQVLGDRIFIMGGNGAQIDGQWCLTPLNDVWYSFPIEHDASVSSITAPSGDVDYGTSVTPSAVVANNGSHTQTFDVVMDIGSDYTDMKQVTVDVGKSCPVDFRSWTATPTGINLTKCRTMLAGDEIPSNDEKTVQARVVLRMPWSEATPSAGWTPRWGHSSAVFDNKLWVMGGSDYPWNTFSDIWSSPDGADWTQVVEQAPWGPRRRFPTIVYNNKLWILGGSQYGDDGYSDVWSSEDGVNWTQVTASASWPGRFLHSAVVFNNKMWVLGGITGNLEHLNDVWCSTNGIDWTQAATPPWCPRYFHTVLVFDGKMWVLGGTDWSVAFDDVWCTEDGESWTCVTANAGWDGRCAHASVVYDNKMWVLGGGWPAGPTRNDVSWSSDGEHWTTAIASWGIRAEPVAQVLGDRVFIMGGQSVAWGSGSLNDVWFTPPAEHDVSVSCITAPSGDVDSGASVTPSAVVANHGDNTETFDVVMDIGSDYTDTKQVTVDAGQSYRVDFRLWTATETDINLTKCRTMLVGDEIPSNDEKTGQVRVVRRMQWSEATPSAGWSPRWGHSSAVFDNKLWVMGGSDYWDGNVYSDIWSSPDGVNWTRVVEQTPWGPRRHFPTIVYNNKLWVLGGEVRGEYEWLYYNDVWSSEDGTSWSQVTAAAPWAGRILEGTAVFQNKMWVLGGFSNSFYGDAWYSENGVDWTQAPTPPWGVRYALTALVFDGKLWVLGGTDYWSGSAFDDVWYTEDGENWTCATSNAGWGGRAGHGSVVSDNKMWVFGGGYPPGPARNDVSWSSDGVNWTTAIASWGGRGVPAAQVLGDRIFVMGGDGAVNPWGWCLTPLNDVWYASSARPDVGVAAILEPSGVIDTLSETPKVTVQNYGTGKVSFAVWFEIKDPHGAVCYLEPATVTDLEGEAQLTVNSFPVWDVPNDVEGQYSCRAWTVLTGDIDPSNDQATSTFGVEAKQQGPPAWTSWTDVPVGPQSRVVQHGAAMATDPMGLFAYLLKGNNTCEFYRYDPATASWSALDPIPERGRDNVPRSVKEGGTLAQVNGKFYATKGGNCLEFWEYNPAAAQGSRWAQKADVPAGVAGVHSGASATGVTAGTNRYVYFLKASATFEFYRYDVANDNWQVMVTAPGPEGQEFKTGSSISFDGTDTVFALKGIFNKFYAYSVATNTWSDKPDLPLGLDKKQAKGGAAICYHLRNVYCIKGSNSQEFWVFDCNAGTWTQGPDVTLGPRKTRVQDGGALVYCRSSRYLFAAKGNCLEFWSFGRLSNYEGPQGVASTPMPIRFSLEVSPSVTSNQSRISYGIPKAGNTRLKLYDVTGRCAVVLRDGWCDPGRYTANLSAKSLARGVYILKLERDAENLTRKVVIE